MIAAGSDTTWCTWRDLLPADRSFVSIPSRRSPVIVAERDGAVLSYVRAALLATPPRSTVPGWVFEAARQLLRVPGAWAVAPRHRPTTGRPEQPTRNNLSDWFADSRYRLVVLDHSHDPDRRFIFLLFPPGSADPSVAVKVATCAASALRLDAERDRLRAIDGPALDAVNGTVPRLVAMDGDLPALATTAQAGVPMLVTYHRMGHTRRRRRVRADFAAASSWLGTLQSMIVAGPERLDIAQSTVDAAQAQLADTPSQLALVQIGLTTLRRRLRRHRTPRTIVHGDFWAGNILVRDGAVSGVVDWERSEPAGAPVRDLARFAVTYSLYLDRHSRPSARVAGHPGYIAGTPGGGVGYALEGTGWYPQLVHAFLDEGLSRLGLPASLGPDLMLAELAAIAAEASDDAFAHEQWRTFGHLCERLR
ncbi:MAG: phosphotransferase [Actinomycetota bacterium]|nr:phosphotransferase [Actinomycetota bacterium]